MVAAGEPIGSFNSHSIEIGFADGQSDTALAHTAYSPDGADTAAGRAMNQLLRSLGAPGPCARRARTRAPRTPRIGG
jgi:hypothetical protein